MPASTPAAFISYSREDSEFALRLAQDLKAAGAHVWLDQLDILPGRPWDNAIEQALGEAMQMLIILSPESAKSENVRDEVSYALGQGKIIIPVLYKDCVVPLRLQRTQRIDFRADYARGLNHLLEHLHVTEPDPSVLQKAAEGDAQRQAAWQAREREAQRMREVVRQQGEDAKRSAHDGAEHKTTEGGAAKWGKPVAIAGAAVVAVVAIVALTVFLLRPRPNPSPPQPSPPQPINNTLAGPPAPGPNPPAPNPSAGPDPIVGCYAWFNNAPVVIRANHTMTGGPFTATWQVVNAAKRAYMFTWPQPVVDTVVVNPDQQSLGGSNQYGFPIVGTRTSGSSGLVGTWNWYFGTMTVSVTANGLYSQTLSAGMFFGTWQPKPGVPGTYLMTASELPKDSVTLSADGTHISGADQYGVAITGVRTQPCAAN
ncbi:MAG: toll/interleukin-1 receptor domain-containing protein [Acidobacteriaceae bacterium]